jgi:hypothetical protein
MQIALMNDKRMKEANELRREEVKASNLSEERRSVLKDAENRAEYLVDKIDADAKTKNADKLKVALKMYGQYKAEEGFPPEVRKALIDKLKESIYEQNMRIIHKEMYENSTDTQPATPSVNSPSPPAGTGSVGSTGITSTGGITVAGIPSK